MWRAAATTGENLSLQAHLVADPSQPPLVADSLGFSSEQWRPGDWFLQRHVFPPGATGAYFETGLYAFQTLEAVGQRLRLPAAP